MNPDLAITIIFGGWATLIGIAVSYLVWRAARLSRDPEGVEKLKRVLAADHRAGDRAAEPGPSSFAVPRGSPHPR